MRYCLQPGDTPLFGVERGCNEFEQRILQFSEGGEPRVNADDDELLYVLSGGGAATLGDARTELAPGTAAFVSRGTPWRVEGGDGLEILSVLVRRPLPAEGHAVFDVGASEADSATAGRMFRLLANPDTGCPSATQFVGYIPVGRAPDHFHTYDEVVYVLEGEGALHIDGESERLTTGSAVHLPARLVHCLENSGPGEMQVLGVFRPAGSPAEAYYPDGTRAQY